MDGKREINNKGAIYSMRPKVHKIYLKEYGKYNGQLYSKRIPQMMKVANQRKSDHQLAINTTSLCMVNLPNFISQPDMLLLAAAVA